VCRVLLPSKQQQQQKVEKFTRREIFFFFFFCFFSIRIQRERRGLLEWLTEWMYGCMYVCMNVWTISYVPYSVYARASVLLLELLSILARVSFYVGACMTDSTTAASYLFYFCVFFLFFSGVFYGNFLSMDVWVGCYWKDWDGVDLGGTWDAKCHLNDTL
jgi:hypothetical protein